MNPRTSFVCGVARKVRKLEPHSHPLSSNNASLYTALTSVFVAGLVPESVDPREQMAILSLFYMAAWFWNADNLQTLLRESEWMRWLAHMPISRDRSFGILYRMFLNRAASWSLTLGAMSYFVPGVGGWEFLGICLLQFTLMVAVSSLLSTWESQIPHALVGLVLGAGGLLLVPISITLSFSEGVARTLLKILPTGWAQAALLHQNQYIIYAIVLNLVLMGAALLRLRPIYLNYQPSSQSVLLDTGDPFQEWVEDAAALYAEYDLRPAAELREVAKRDGLESLRKNVRTRWWLEPYEWWTQGGFLARWIALKLSAREKRLVEFLLLARPSWTRRWKQSLILATVSALALSFLPSEAQWIAYGSFGLSAYIALVPPAMHGMSTVLRTVAYFRLHPLGPGEIAQVFLKIESIRFLCFLPMFCGFALLSRATGTHSLTWACALLGLQWISINAKLAANHASSQMLAFVALLCLLGGLVGQQVLLGALGLILSYLSLKQWTKL